jgi:hypothetical protein
MLPGVERGCASGRRLCVAWAGAPAARVIVAMNRSPHRFAGKPQDSGRRHRTGRVVCRRTQVPSDLSGYPEQEEHLGAVASSPRRSTASTAASTSPLPAGRLAQACVRTAACPEGWVLLTAVLIGRAVELLTEALNLGSDDAFRRHARPGWICYSPNSQRMLVVEASTGTPVNKGVVASANRLWSIPLGRCDGHKDH